MRKTGILKIEENRCAGYGYWAWLKPSEKDSFVKELLDRISMWGSPTKLDGNKLGYEIDDKAMNFIKSKMFENICDKSDTIIYFIKVEEAY